MAECFVVMSLSDPDMQSSGLRTEKCSSKLLAHAYHLLRGADCVAASPEIDHLETCLRICPFVCPANMSETALGPVRFSPSPPGCVQIEQRQSKSHNQNSNTRRFDPGPSRQKGQKMDGPQ